MKGQVKKRERQEGKEKGRETGQERQGRDRKEGGEKSEGGEMGRREKEEGGEGKSKGNFVPTVIYKSQHLWIIFLGKSIRD